MADDNEPPHPGSAAMYWLSVERGLSDAALGELKGLDIHTLDQRAVTKYAAILIAQSNRELAAATVTASETLDLRLKKVGLSVDSSATNLGVAIDTLTGKSTDSTDALTRWTKRLVIATWALAVAAIVAAAIQAYATTKSQVRVTVVPVPVPAAAPP